MRTITKPENIAYNMNDISQGDAPKPKETKIPDQTPLKPAGIPLGIKIFMIIAVLALGGYYAYTKLYVKLPEPAPIAAPTPNIFSHKGEIVVAKCKDFCDISLYLESDITMDDYKTTLLAVSTIRSASLEIPNQELTYKSPNGKIMVYKCQRVKGILMGKLKKL